MDFGAEFDDDFFEKPREKNPKEPRNYEAKVLYPLWYMEQTLTNKEPSEVLESLKHQADYHYFMKNYKSAADLYEQCLALTPSSNNTWKREFMENLARSLLHLGESNKALEWSLKLDESAQSPDQKIVSMNLLALVCHKLGKYQEELEALHCCLEVHKSSPEFWQRLALCYAGLFNIQLPEYSSCAPLPKEPCCAFNKKTNSLKQEENDLIKSECFEIQSAISPCISATEQSVDQDSKPVTEKCDVCTLGIQMVSSCLIHTKNLIDTGGRNILAAERDNKIQEKITKSLAYMEVEQSFIDVASKMLGSDFLANLQINDNTESHQPEKSNIDSGT